MRLFRFLPFLALAFIFAATACQKDVTTAPVVSLSFFLDSTQYNCKSGDAIMMDTMGKKALEVRGLTNNFAQNVILLIPLDSANARPGTYYGSMVFADSILQADYATTWIGDSVQVNLTQLDGVHAAGTFSGHLFRNEKGKTVSQGKFNVTY
jgi:hypothetical protein